MEKKTCPAFEYELAKQKVKQQLRSGKSLFSNGRAFAPFVGVPKVRLLKVKFFNQFD